MDLTRRALLAATAAVAFAGRASAQEAWPNRPVRVMVPYPPAGGADTTARIIYARLSEDLGQQFAIENRGGAGGTIAEAIAAKADPDGYTVLHDATAFSINGSLYENLSFDYRNSFDPVFLVGLVANILIATPSLPVNTVADVIAYAKSQPDGIDMESSGNGTLQHLLLELFARSAGIKTLSWRRRGGQRRDGGAGEICLRQRLIGISFGESGEGEGHCANRKRPARDAARNSADVRHIAGIRRLRLERRIRSPRHAGRYRQEAQRKPQRCADFAAGQRAICRAQRRDAAEYAAGIRRLCRKPDAVLEPHRERRQHQAGLNAARFGNDCQNHRHDRGDAAEE